MTTFSATFDANAFNSKLQSLSRINQFGAFGRALSRAGQSMRKQAIVEAQAVLNLKAGPVRDVIDLKQVNRADFKAELVVKARAVPLYDFKGTRGTKRGLSVQVKKGGSRKVIATGFIATMKSGKTLAVRRRFVSGKSGKQVGRLKLDVLYSTSVVEALDDRSAQLRIVRAGMDRFVPELKREIERRLAGSPA